MKVPALLFMVTAAVIFLQLVAGVLFVFGFFSSELHITTGIITGIFSLAIMVAALVSKPRYNALRLTSVMLFLLVLLQAGLGWASLPFTAKP